MTDKLEYTFKEVLDELEPDPRNRPGRVIDEDDAIEEYIKDHIWMLDDLFARAAGLEGNVPRAFLHADLNQMNTMFVQDEARFIDIEPEFSWFSETLPDTHLSQVVYLMQWALFLAEALCSKPDSNYHAMVVNALCPLKNTRFGRALDAWQDDRERFDGIQKGTRLFADFKFDDPTGRSSGP